MLKIKDIEKYIDDSLLESIFREREDELYVELKNEDEDIIEIKQKYDVDYEKLINKIKNLPPHFNNTREEIIKSLDKYIMRENLIRAYDNEKFYKAGFCDGIRIIIEKIKNK